MSHEVHIAGAQWVLSDSCPECVQRSKTPLGLRVMDPENLFKLGLVAVIVQAEKRTGDKTTGISDSDRRAAEWLVEYAQIVFKSRITTDTAFDIWATTFDHLAYGEGEEE